MKFLICCCCGERTIGKQWWNRDKGYGVCKECGEREEKRAGIEEAQRSFGVKGKNWAIEEKNK
jgi:hypothetical protein